MRKISYLENESWLIEFLVEQTCSLLIIEPSYSLLRNSYNVLQSTRLRRSINKKFSYEVPHLPSKAKPSHPE